MARQGVAVLWTDDIMLASSALTAGVRAANRKVKKIICVYLVIYLFFNYYCYYYYHYQIHNALPI